MKRHQRLRTAADFAQVRARAGRGWSNPLLVVYVAPNEQDYVRVGITVSRRVGNAVVRNRVRRRVREALRARVQQLTQGTDVLVIARPALAHAGWSELCNALDEVLRRSTQKTDATETAAACV